MRQSLLSRVRRVEASVPVRCPGCGRTSTADMSYSTLVLFRLESGLVRYDGTPVAEEDLRPCRACGVPKERCGKVLVGVDPKWL